MPSPRFDHGYAHDVFISYTHTDNRPDDGLHWVTKFTEDLKGRLEKVSGHAVDVWRDEEKLGAADRFDDAIETAIRNSAVMLVVLTPSYFNSEPCKEERESFYVKIAAEGRASLGDKSRVLKVVKTRVEIQTYPDDLKQLLEHRFYKELPGPRYKEFHLSEEAAVRSLYMPKVDDVAIEIAGLLSTLSPAEATADPRGIVYLAEGTSDVEPDRERLRRWFIQQRFDVHPKRELRLMSAEDAKAYVADTLKKARLAVFPVGGFFGLVPEGADGKSLVQMQLDLAQADRQAGGDMTRVIWIPKDVQVHEKAQEAFLEQIRRELAGRAFELVEDVYKALEDRLTEWLRGPVAQAASDAIAASNGLAPQSRVYVICDNLDRTIAKRVRSFIFNQRQQVEWTPADAGDLATSKAHHDLLKRNNRHLVVHGATLESWIQNRINELTDARQSGTVVKQGIYLVDPKRPDKEDILAHDIVVIDGYPPAIVGSGLDMFLREN